MSTSSNLRPAAPDTAAIGRRAWMLQAAMASIACTAGPAFAQPAAGTTLTIVLPYTSGGSSDTTTRLIAEEMRKIIGRPVVVLNKAGGNTLIGNAFAARAEPDGNTLLIASNSGFINNIALYDKLPYDPVKDFTPVVLLCMLPMMIAVRKDAPARTLGELVAYAQANPGKLTRSSAGSANITNIGMRYFEDKRGIRMLHVPYAGDAQALNALIAGEVDVYMTTVAAMRQHVQSGRIRGLAILGKTARRDAQLPDVPTVTEAGFPEFDVDSWYALVAPAKTPRAVIDELNRAANTVLQDPQVIESMRRFGVEPAGGSAEDLDRLLEFNRNRWVPEIRRMAIKADQ